MSTTQRAADRSAAGLPRALQQCRDNNAADVSVRKHSIYYVFLLSQSVVSLTPFNLLFVLYPIKERGRFGHVFGSIMIVVGFLEGQKNEACEKALRKGNMLRYQSVTGNFVTLPKKDNLTKLILQHKLSVDGKMPSHLEVDDSNCEKVKLVFWEYMVNWILQDDFDIGSFYRPLVRAISGRDCSVVALAEAKREVLCALCVPDEIISKIALALAAGGRAGTGSGADIDNASRRRANKQAELPHRSAAAFRSTGGPPESPQQKRTSFICNDDDDLGSPLKRQPIRQGASQHRQHGVQGHGHILQPVPLTQPTGVEEDNGGYAQISKQHPTSGLEAESTERDELKSVTFAPIKVFEAFAIGGLNENMDLFTKFPLEGPLAALMVEAIKGWQEAGQESEKFDALENWSGCDIADHSKEWWWYALANLADLVMDNEPAKLQFGLHLLYNHHVLKGDGYHQKDELIKRLFECNFLTLKEKEDFEDKKEYEALYQKHLRQLFLERLFSGTCMKKFHELIEEVYKSEVLVEKINDEGYRHLASPWLLGCVPRPRIDNKNSTAENVTGLPLDEWSNKYTDQVKLYPTIGLDALVLRLKERMLLIDEGSLVASPRVPKDVQVTGFIGKGSTGLVVGVAGVEKTDNTCVKVEYVYTSDLYAFLRGVVCMLIMNANDSGNIVNLDGLVWERDKKSKNRFKVMMFMPVLGKSFEDVYGPGKMKLSAKEGLRLLSQFAGALAHSGKLDIIHRDM